MMDARADRDLRLGKGSMTNDAGISDGMPGKAEIALMWARSELD